MNRLRRQIKQRMYDLNGNASGKISARFIFPEEFIGFQGHFPGRPVLPGVCQIQAVMVILEAWNNRSVRLQEIVQAKFFNRVSGGDELFFECQQRRGPRAELLVKASVTGGEIKIAEFQLIAGFGDERQY